MPSQPETVNDTVLYTLRNFHGDKDVTVRMLDGSILDIWGPVFVNGQPLVGVGQLPIATQPEAIAGTDNTKVMTPLRVREAGDARYLKLTGGVVSGSLQVGDVAVNGFATFEDMFVSGDIEVEGSVFVPDEVYGVAWNGSLEVPTKNAVYDKVQTLAPLRYAAATSAATSYTLALTDEPNLTNFTAATAIAMTVPANATVAFAVGTKIDFYQSGAGKITVAGAGGVTVNGTPSLVLRAQYSAASLIKVATDTWLLTGDLT